MRETLPSRLKNHLSEWHDFHIHIADSLGVLLNVSPIERLGRWWTNGNVTPYVLTGFLGALGALVTFALVPGGSFEK